MSGNTWATARCRICGKEIVVRDCWAYKFGGTKKHYVYFCSWKHLQEFKRGRERKTKERGLKRGEKVGQ